MAEKTIHVITLRKNEERRILAGHQWIFSNEILDASNALQSGDVVEIRRCDGKFLGCGFYNPNSLIAVRFLSPVAEEINTAFFEKRIHTALALRMKLYPTSSTFRVVHGESDFLPGLIIDKFNDFLSVQTFSAGMDIHLNSICDALEQIFSPRGIIERNESPSRQLENLPVRKNILRGTIEPTVIDFNGIKFQIDILEGQKTGFFLDQRENRAALKPFVQNQTVLDCFCNEGGFGIHAAAFGAASVESVDISELAIEKARANAQLNNLKNISFRMSDVFEILKNAVEENKKYGVVVLDPPSFTKSKKNIPNAIKGYREINTNGLKLVAEGGTLATASCSHHIDDETFLNIVRDSAVKAGRKIQLLHFAGAAPDHPTLPAMPETKYLKFALFNVE